ncbi:MAG TPA: HAMP domain-containing sensor histidine kinase [Anaeromyxobacteraceae bacterium]|nr:HAMP domain-containing sensor histidine kinase [Anaeromyxobacteraceae bacterium]
MRKQNRRGEAVALGSEMSEGRLPWREGVAATLLRATFIIAILGIPLILMLTQSVPLRLVGSIALMVFTLALGIELWRPRLGVRGRGLLLVSGYLALSLIGYLFLGFLSGPALFACAALLIARVLLGRRALLTAACILIASVGLIAWALISERLPWEFPALDVSAQELPAWVRTGGGAILLLAAIGLLVSLIIEQIEVSMRDNVRILRESQRATRLRDEFLSIASHELRTPVAALQLASEGLISGRIPPTTQNLQRSFGIIQRNVVRLNSLVGQLLDVSRIETGRLDLMLEDVDLSALVSDVVELFVGRPDGGKPIALALEPAVRGRWDRGRLEQVVTNLLSNALKFGGGRPVEVSVQHADARALLRVRDHGAGIAPEVAPHIFERFCRGAPPSAGGGFGLGLFVVRSIVSALGGAVHAETAVGGGAAFTVDLPVLGPLPKGRTEHAR